MSVPVNQRIQGKLKAYTLAYELATYTIKITSNKNIFTVEYQEALTEKIVNTALNIYLLVGEANDISVKTAEDKQKYLKRIDMQNDAYQLCGVMNKLILIAKPVFHLSSKRIKYWTGLVKDTKTTIKAWSESDKRRFAPLFK